MHFDICHELTQAKVDVVNKNGIVVHKFKYYNNKLDNAQHEAKYKLNFKMHFQHGSKKNRRKLQFTVLHSIKSYDDLQQIKRENLSLMHKFVFHKSGTMEAWSVSFDPAQGAGKWFVCIPAMLENGGSTL